MSKPTKNQCETIKKQMKDELKEAPREDKPELKEAQRDALSTLGCMRKRRKK